MDTTPGFVPLPARAAALTALPGLARHAQLIRWRFELTRCEERRAIPPGMPLLTVLLGPTGAGKSTVCNWLAGSTVSSAGAVRPWTAHPLVLGEAHVLDATRRDPVLTELEAAGAVTWHLAPPALAQALSGQALIDAPDFDGVRADHRALAVRLRERADRAILVLNPEKYGDASVWEFAAELAALGSLTGCIFNRSRGGEALLDCRARLRTIGAPDPVELPWADDPAATLDAPRVAALHALLEVRQPLETLRRERRLAAEAREQETRVRSIEPWLDRMRTTHQSALRELEALATRMPERLAQGLPLRLDAALRQELQQRFLAEVERLDPLREPRRWLLTPWRWLGARLGGGGGATAVDAAARTPAAWLAQAYRDPWDELLLQLTGSLRALLPAADAEAGGAEPPTVCTPDRDTQQAQLTAICQGLEDEIRSECDRIAAGLSLGGKIGFYGSQALFHATLLVLFVKTGGLAVTELAAQGLASPFVARLAGHLISSGESEALEQRLEASFHARARAQLEPLVEVVRSHLVSVLNAAGTHEQWQASTRGWQLHGDR